MTRISRRVFGSIPMIAASLALVATAQTARATDAVGTVQFSGRVIPADPNIPIVLQDFVVAVKPDVAESGSGVKCTLGTTTSDNPDPDGTYPGAAGKVSVPITMSKGGNKPPDGLCIVTVTASGNDGASVTARGSKSVFLDPNTISSSATLTGIDITVKRTKAIAGISRDCEKWIKKQHKKRAKCNFLILKKGGLVAVDKCKTACSPDPGPCEPADCDPNDYTEAVLAFSHDANDQQTDTANGLGVDWLTLRDQVKCQKHLGFAAANYLKKRNHLIERRCIEASADSEACRSTQSNTAKKKLDRISKCVANQMVDPNSTLAVPKVQDPCSACISGGVIDTKCMRACFQSVLDEYSDLILGDVPVCGNGIKQPPEQCDDGNTANGDGCSSVCMLEP